MNLSAKSLSGIISKIYFHISPLFTRVKHNLIFSTTSGHLHVVLIEFLFLAVYWNLNLLKQDHGLFFISMNESSLITEISISIESFIISDRKQPSD